jgi:hypothetical protein
MATEEQRENRLKLLDDHIGRSLAQAHASGELRAAPGYGKPLDLGDGYDETPAELRMPFKMLKDSGFVPPEIELMREIEALRLALANEAPDPNSPQRQRLTELQQQLAWRMERLGSSGSL